METQRTSANLPPRHGGNGPECLQLEGEAEEMQSDIGVSQKVVLSHPIAALPLGLRNPAGNALSQESDKNLGPLKSFSKGLGSVRVRKVAEGCPLKPILRSQI